MVFELYTHGVILCARTWQHEFNVQGCRDTLALLCQASQKHGVAGLAKDMTAPS